MATLVFTESVHNGGFIVSEEPGTRSRDQGILISGQGPLQAATVLGKITTSTAAPVAAANAGNTGNGTCGAVTESAGAKVGAYSLLFNTATEYTVYDPNGAEVGKGNTGVAFAAGGLAFTITAGGVAMVAGDGFTITVVAGSGKYTQLAPAAADGSQIAAGILWGLTDASAGDTACTVVTTAAEVNAAELIYPNGISAPQKAAALAQLLALGIKAR